MLFRSAVEQDNLELDRAELVRLLEGTTNAAAAIQTTERKVIESIAFREGKIETYKEALTLLKKECVKVAELTFECTHDTVARTMTCSWNEGRIAIVYYFGLQRTAVYVDDELKRTDDKLTIDEFMKLQWECQGIADMMK